MTVVAALALSVPSLWAFSAGQLSVDALAVRLVLGLVLSRVAIGGLDHLVRGYATTADERPPDADEPD